MEFDKSVKVAGREQNRLQIAGKSCLLAELFEAAILLIPKSPGLLRGKDSAHQPAPQTPDAEAGRLLRSEKYQFDRPARLKAGALQGPDGFEAAEYTNHPVISSGVGDGVNVRAGGDGSLIWIGRGRCPAQERVADRVFAEGEPRGEAQVFDVSPATQIRFAEDDTGYDRRLGFRDMCQGGDLSHECVIFDNRFNFNHFRHIPVALLSFA